MASTKLVREVLEQASFHLQDLSPDRSTQFDRYTQRAMVAALNDGQRVIAKYLPASCSRLDAFKLAPGTRQSIAVVPPERLIAFDGTNVSRIGRRLLSPPSRNLGTDGLTPGKVIRAGDRITQDAADPNWHTSTGTAVQQVFYDPATPKDFFVSPGVPINTAVWVELPWLPEPLEVSASGNYAANGSDATKISVDDANYDDLVNFVVARMLLIEAEFSDSINAAGAYVQAFVSSMNLQAVASGLPNPKLSALPTAAQGN